MKNTDTGTDRNISLVAGWNLIGYNGAVNTSLSNAVFNNGSNSYTWQQALANNKVQAYLAYYDNNAQDNLTQYKYMSTLSGFDDTAFRQNKGYWIHTNEAGTLTIPEVGGTMSGQTFAWSKLRFSNGSGAELSITVAESSGWIEKELKYRGWNGLSYSFLDINGFDEEEVSKSTISPWEGIFIWSYKDNITLIRQN